MSTSSPENVGPPPRRVFGVDESALADDTSPTAAPRAPRHGRMSFSRLHHHPSFATRWSRQGAVDEEAPTMGAPPERPLIPSALQQPGEPYTAPLPKLSMTVLSIVSSY